MLPFSERITEEFKSLTLRLIRLGRLLSLTCFGFLLASCAENQTDELPTIAPVSEIAAKVSEPTAQVTATSIPAVPTATPTPTPTSSPTPAPISYSIDGLIPADYLHPLTQLSTAQFIQTDEEAELAINLTRGEPIGSLVFAVAAKFPTVRDDITMSELTGAQLFGTAETVAIWQTVFPQIQAVPEGKLGETLWSTNNSLAILPFDALTPDLKVLAIDGQSPLRREFEPAAYPLALQIGLEGAPDAVAAFRENVGFLTNRDPEKMTRVAMTGVTALVRATAAQMEYAGVLFPGEVVAPIMQSADIAHISNEVPFAENCPFPNAVSQSVTFCSRDNYFELLTHLGVDVVEVTGNHSNDYGTDAMLRSLNKYTAANMNYYGGGINHSDAFQPAFVYDHGNKIAFVGCNSFGPVGAWATADRPGTAKCGDLGEMKALISRLSGEGYVVISTFQYEEIYSYAATASQKRDFGALAEAGASAVSGSQSHHPQAFAFENGGYIHYGLGNLFFDQMFSLGTRQVFIDEYVIYDGQLISVELWTGLIEHYSRPREMTPAERYALLNSVFRASGW